MEKFKGTKGQWRVRNDHNMLFVESPKEDLQTPYGQEIMADDYFNEEEKFYDAHLIASAPEMLKQLQYIKMCCDLNSKSSKKKNDKIAYSELSDIAQKVIEKALAKNV